MIHVFFFFFFFKWKQPLIYLPAYSPDLNPAKEAFSAIKAWLRANRTYLTGEMGTSYDLYALIWEAVYSSITTKHTYG